jgi:hypothetical protein
MQQRKILAKISCSVVAHQEQFECHEGWPDVVLTYILLLWSVWPELAAN